MKTTLTRLLYLCLLILPLTPFIAQASNPPSFSGIPTTIYLPPPDYITITNGTAEAPPQQLRIGDHFQGLTLESIQQQEHRWESGTTTTSTRAFFSGDIILTAAMHTYSGCSTSPGIQAYSFWLDDATRAQLPRIASRERSPALRLISYDIQNTSEWLGLSPRQIRAVNRERIVAITSAEITMQACGVYISCSGAIGFRELPEILSQAQLSFTTRVPDSYILIAALLGLIIIIVLAAAGVAAIIKWATNKGVTNR